MNQQTISHCGFIAIIGRPNVGKSTLLNALLAQKISITSDKPQTTRHVIRGIKTIDHNQMVFIDTPGIHQQQHHQLNKVMNKAALNALNDDVDVILFLIEAMRFTKEDEWVAEQLKNMQAPIILVVNKVDKIADKEKLLPFLQEVAEKVKYQAVFPISALKNKNVTSLEDEIIKLLPESPHFFLEDQRTDRDERFLCSELIREKLIRQLSQEVPYELTVVIESFKDKEKFIEIHAIIYVEKEGQKGILIGKAGERLKAVGTRARLDIEKLVNKKVNLKLWVKVKSGWSDDVKALQRFGYEP